MSRDDKPSELFQLLKDMTVPPPKGASSPPPKPLMQRIEKWLLIALVAALLLLVIAVAWYRFESSAPSSGINVVTGALSIAVLLLAVLYPIVSTINMAWTAWRERHEYFPVLFAAMQRNLQTDATFLARLWGFDKRTLEYGLIQYRHHWSMPDRRVGSLVGDIRKIGLFPALAATVVSAATLMKAGSNLYLWIPVAVTCALYMVGFITVNQHERSEQVIALLEYAIRHADDPPVLTRIDAVPAEPTSKAATSR